MSINFCILPNLGRLKELCWTGTVNYNKITSTSEICSEHWILQSCHIKTHWESSSNKVLQKGSAFTNIGNFANVNCKIIKKKIKSTVLQH